MNKKEIKQHKIDSLEKWKWIEEQLWNVKWAIEVICGYCDIVDCCCSKCIMSKNKLCDHTDNKKYKIWECQENVATAMDAAYIIRKFIEKDMQ